jgi:hypothetical protein
MKSFKLLVALFVSALFLLFTIGSCIKKNDPVEVDYTSGEDVGFSQGLLSNIFDAVIDVASTQGDTSIIPYTILPQSVKITYTDSLLTDGDGLEYAVEFLNIDSVTLNGGTQCIDARTRGGKLYITQSSFFNDPKVKITVEMRDDAEAHYVGNGTDMAKFVGILNIQRNSNRTFTLNMTNGTVKFKTGTVRITVTQSITFLADVTPGIWTQSYSVTGTCNGSNRNKEAFTSFVGIALVKKLTTDCTRTYTQGKVEVTTTAKNNTVNVDYDPGLDGACDRIFKISLIDGQSQTYKVT